MLGNIIERKKDDENEIFNILSGKGIFHMIF